MRSHVASLQAAHSVAAVRSGHIWPCAPGALRSSTPGVSDFKNAVQGQIETRDGTDIRLGGIGGLSSMIGWTEVQQEAAGPLGGFKGVLLIVRFLLICYVTVVVMLDFVPFQTSCMFMGFRDCGRSALNKSGSDPLMIPIPIHSLVCE